MIFDVRAVGKPIPGEPHANLQLRLVCKGCGSDFSTSNPTRSGDHNCDTVRAC